MRLADSERKPAILGRNLLLIRKGVTDFFGVRGLDRVQREGVPGRRACRPCLRKRGTWAPENSRSWAAPRMTVKKARARCTRRGTGGTRQKQTLGLLAGEL